MNKFFKKYLSLTMVIAILFSFGYVIAGIDDEAQGESGGGGNQMTSSQFRVGNAGTNYDVNYTDSSGVTHTVTVHLQDGEKGSGGMQGYSAHDYSFTQNMIPDGTIYISPDDIANVLAAEGTPEALAAADAIRNGSDYDMYAQQTLFVYNPIDGTAGYKTVEELAAYRETLTPEQQAKFDAELGPALKDALKAWSDEDMENKGHYSRDGEEGNEGDGDNPDDTPPGGGGSHDPRLSVSPGTAGSQDGEAEGSITNSHFGVPGKPIPTSETLTGRGSTNIVGLVQNLRRIYYDI